MTRLTRRMFVGAAADLGVAIGGLTLLASACSLLPTQTPRRVPRIGYLSPGPREARAETFVNPFLDGLRELGYIEGQTIAIEWRFTTPGGDAPYEELAAELVRLPVDLFVTSGTPASLAARHATSATPIVAIGVSDPVGTGLVSNLAHPEGNLTGLTSGQLVGGAVAGKYIDLLRAWVPGLGRVAALVDSTNPFYDRNGWDSLHEAGERAGVHMERIDLRTPDDVDAAFEAAAAGAAQAFIDEQNPLLLPVRSRLAALALQYRLPGTTSGRDYVVAGALMSYTANFPSIHRRGAAYVDKILNGVKPAELPVEQPTVFDLIVNSATARALGLTVRPELAAQVTEWLQ